MKATIGDKVVIRGHAVGHRQRHGTIVDVRGADGEPPYVVRWDDERPGDESDHLVFPGADFDVEHANPG